MTRLIFLLSLLTSFNVSAQVFGKIKKDKDDSGPIIRYYPFYKGVQMIELDYLTAYHRKLNRLEQERPMSRSWSSVLGSPPENVYIFRNTAGVRVKQFGKVTGDVKLLSVKKSKEVALPHNHFRSRIGSTYGFSRISTRIYPYYLIGSNHRYSVTPMGQFGLIDSLGNVILKKEYRSITANYEGSIILTSRDSTHQIRNRDLEVEFSTTEYQLSLSDNQRDVKFYKLNSRVHGIMDGKGNILIPCKYRIIWSFNDYGLARVRNDQYKEGYVDSTGREVIEAKYQNFGKFTEGLIGARINNKRGFLNTKGEVVIPFIYDHAFWFVEGLTRVSKKIDGVYYFGYIDKEGNEVIPLKYANATDFKDGIAEVRIDFEHERQTVRSAKDILNRKPKREGIWIKIDREGNEVK